MSKPNEKSSIKISENIIIRDKETKKHLTKVKCKPVKK